MQKLVFTNGGGQTIDLTSGNFGITNWEGLSNTELNIQTQQVPFQDGGVFLDALMEQREISVTVAIQDNNDLSLRYELKRQLISALNPKLGEGVLVYTNDYLSRQIKAVPQLPIFENKNSNDAGTLKASVVFSCPSPYWEDLGETVVNASLKSISVINNEGDVPAQVEIEMYGNAVNPKITNLSSNKHIEYKGQIDMPLYINTRLGVKEVSTESISFEYDQYKGYIWGVYYVDKINSYIALSEDCLLYSVDGNNWETHILGLGNFCISMCYDSNLDKYFICCSNGKILSSSDLYNWEVASVIPHINFFNVITYSEELNLLVAGGSGTTQGLSRGQIFTSTDGINWTLRCSVTPQSMLFMSIVYSAEKELFVAVGVLGNIYTSSDGVTWTSQTSGVTDNLESVVYSSALGIFIVAGYGGKILTSSDGVTWTSQTSGTSANLFCVIEVLNKINIAGVGVVLTSSDGTSWSKEDVSEIEYNPWGFCYSNVTGKYVITGKEGMIVSSEDGIEWERKDYGEYLIIHGIAFSKGLYVAVCEGGVIITSPNKKEWTERTSGVTSNINDIIFSKEKGLFVAVCQDGKVIKSNDGINWEVVATLSATLIKIKWIPEKEKYIFINSTSSINKIYIANSDFTEINGYNAPYVVSDIAYSPKINKFAVCFNTGNNQYNMAITEDFNSYDSKRNPYVVTGEYAIMNSIVYSAEQDLFVAVGIRTLSSLPNTLLSPVPVLVSSDGNIWTKAETPIAEATYGVKIIYSTTYEKFVITGQEGLIGMSSDGLNWESFNSGVATILYDVIDQDFDLVFVGDSSIVLSSVAESIQNEIQNISEDSDLSFNLGIGENRIRLTKGSGNFTVKIKYRQKYIGV